MLNGMTTSYLVDILALYTQRKNLKMKATLTHVGGSFNLLKCHPHGV